MRRQAVIAFDEDWRRWIEECNELPSRMTKRSVTWPDRIAYRISNMYDTKGTSFDEVIILGLVHELTFFDEIMDSLRTHMRAYA